jgi:hypothetical protein
MALQTLKGANSNPAAWWGQIRQTQVLIKTTGFAGLKYINSSDSVG